MDGEWENYLKHKRHWVESKDTVFIFDEAQTSYTEGALWNDFFKCMADYPRRRAIAFVSFGSASSVISIQGTPIFISDAARITMLPTTHDDLPPVGLFFNHAEFDEPVQQYPSPEYHFHPSFLQTVFCITQGHIGAMCDVINIVLGYDVGFAISCFNKKSQSDEGSYSHIVN